MSATIHTHPLTGPSSATTIAQTLDILRPRLPVSLPLYRRLQYGRFIGTSVLLTNFSSSEPQAGQTKNDRPHLLAYIDRASRPETEVLISCSWEGQTKPPSPRETTEAEKEEQNALIHAFAREVKSLGLPVSTNQELLDAEVARLEDPSMKLTDMAGISGREYAAHILNPNIVLCGAVHEETVAVFERLGLVSRAYKNASNYTYVFDVDNLPTPRALPPSLRWGRLRYEDLALVRSRTQIPRQAKTLAALPSIAIIDKTTDAPISWAFCGSDGSLTSLHVEPDFRGQGLAKAITVKLFQEQMAQCWENNVKRQAHGYVIVGNDASSRVCQSLGGQSDWEVNWVRMDLGTM